MSIFYKQIEAVDYETCATLIRTSFEPLLDQLGISEDALPNFGAFLKTRELKNYLRRGVELIGAYDTVHENRLVGCVGIQMTKVKRCKIIKLSVHPEHRHLGIGKMLMNEAELAGFRKGAREIELGLIHQNSELEAWYESLGYRISKVRRYKQSGFDITLMLKKVTHLYQISQPLNPHPRLSNEIIPIQLERDTRSKLLLIYHKNELYKNTNTGMYLQKALPFHTEEWLWQRNDDQELMLYLKGRALEGYQPILVYPKDESEVGVEFLVGDHTTMATDDQRLYILLDCTWQEAKKIFQQSDQLRLLPRISLEVNHESVYNLRRHQKSYGLCTAETGFELMAPYMKEENKNLFLEQMNSWLKCDK